MIARQRYPFLLALGLGLTYALVTRFLFTANGFFQLFDSSLLSLAFLVVMPLGLGAITAHFTPKTASSWWRLVWAYLSGSTELSGSGAGFSPGRAYLRDYYESAVLVHGLAGRNDLRPHCGPAAKNRDKALVVAAFALLPFVAGPLENYLNNPDDFRRVENVVEINAPAAVVWQHIIRVAPIRAADLGPSIIDKIGFPRPVEATLSHEGVGGVRHATFERGVEFIETVDEWQPLKRLSFSIVPNTATIPPTTFDEHVIVGGRFFDVLRGTYELHPAGPGRTRLVLHSRQRLSTHLNWYAGLWTSFVMREIQQRILTVLKRRCEAAR